MKSILVVAQAINQKYLDILINALGDNAIVNVLTGSEINTTGQVIQSPSHNPLSLKSRLSCWWQHYRFLKKWMSTNKDRKYDLIFANSNPPINSYMLLKLKQQFKAPVIYMNWDLYPQVIETSIKNPIAKIICNLWHKWNSNNYSHIDKMITIGDVLSESINKDLKTPIPIEVIPLPTDINELKPIPKQDNTFLIKHALQDKFIILYSGKMGLGHNIEMILEASKKLKDYKNIHFVFIGSGQKYSTVESFIETNEPKNISLFPLQPNDIFPYSIACGDIGIVTQELSMAHLFMPSKTFSMMACGEAILGVCSQHDDLQQLISKYDIGLTVIENNPKLLAEKILFMYNNPFKLNEWKTNARKTVERHFSTDVVITQYNRLFKQFIPNLKYK